MNESHQPPATRSLAPVDIMHPDIRRLLLQDGMQKVVAWIRAVGSAGSTVALRQRLIAILVQPAARESAGRDGVRRRQVCSTRACARLHRGKRRARRPPRGRRLTSLRGGSIPWQATRMRPCKVLRRVCGHENALGLVGRRGGLQHTEACARVVGDNLPEKRRVEEYAGAEDVCQELSA